MDNQDNAPNDSHPDTESSTIGGSKKNAPEGATNTTRRLTNSNDQSKGVASNMLPQNGWYLEDHDFAIHYLETAQRDYEHARHMRLRRAENARKHGITNKVIGQIYGVTEGAIRKMLKQAGEQ